MASDKTKSWREIRGQRALNETRLATYRRLMEAEERLDGLRRRRGLNESAIGDLLEATESREQEDDIYLATVGRYVEALGGRIEVRAVFPDETIMLLRVPERG